MNIKMTELSDAIVSAVETYTEEVADSLNEVIQEEGKKGPKTVRKHIQQANINTSAKSPYKRGWTCTIQKIRGGMVKAVIHNKKEYRLTHLLEKGHDIVRNDMKVGEAGAFKHIEPAEKEIMKKVEKEVEKII